MMADQDDGLERRRRLSWHGVLAGALVSAVVLLLIAEGAARFALGLFQVLAMLAMLAEGSLFDPSRPCKEIEANMTSLLLKVGSAVPFRYAWSPA